MKTRRELLEEVIVDYLDSGESARYVYEEFLAIMAAECQSRENVAKKALELRDLMLGNRPTDLFDF